MRKTAGGHETKQADRNDFSRTKKFEQIALDVLKSIVKNHYNDGTGRYHTGRTKCIKKT